ncbi:hypothetical protein NQZ68_010225 [Dissostichus eleginoides]|nr:hypothetical protein NQZ68_010225 [Dissostichus eleginoides]
MRDSKEDSFTPPLFSSASHHVRQIVSRGPCGKAKLEEWTLIRVDLPAPDMTPLPHIWWKEMDEREHQGGHSPPCPAAVVNAWPAVKTRPACQR